MENLKKYIEKITGELIEISSISKNELGSILPLYMIEMYRFFETVLFGKPFILIELKNEHQLSISLLIKHQALIYEKLNVQPIIVFSNIGRFQRNRLIEKKVQFVIPNTQLFMPYSLIDLNERFTATHTKREKLLPSAQLLLISYLLNKKNEIKELPFQELANKFGYSPMAISKAANNLVSLELCKVEEQHKEKFIHFTENKYQLWKSAASYLINPVLKTVYADSLPNNLIPLKSNFSALAEYSDMNPSRQQYFALEKTLFYGLQKADQFQNLNPYEGNYCLEIWKYNPKILAGTTLKNKNLVDPLSLYLSLKNTKDERTEYALEKLIEESLW